MRIFPLEAERLAPGAFYADMRRHAPVTYSEADGAWGVYRYDDVRRVLTDVESFSSERRQQLVAAKPRPSLISMDPPRHRQFRGLVALAFTPKAVAALAPRIEAITRDLLDKVAPTGRMDLVADLAYPLPVTVIAEMLGVPSEDRDRYKAWADRLLKRTSPFLAPSEEREHVLDEMDDYFRQVLEARRRRPENDMISRLAMAELDGVRLSEPEILAFCSLLLLAGHVTTVNLIGNTMLCLLEHPEVMALLRAKPEAIPTAMEEALRYRSPVQFMTRVATRDVELGGQLIRENDLVAAFLASANRDDAVFENPEVFDPTRSPNPHVAFGYGIHFCLGAPLARLEGQIAMRQLLERLPKLALAPLSDASLARWAGKPMDPLESELFQGVSHLHMHFEEAR